MEDDVFEIVVEDEFSAAHRLCEYNGACERLHGHNYAIALTVCGETLGPSGMLVDFKVVKGALKETLDRLDHRYLNDEIPDFGEGKLNPTAENIALWIGQQVAAKLPEGVALARVAVGESPRSTAIYIPD